MLSSSNRRNNSCYPFQKGKKREPSRVLSTKPSHFFPTNIYVPWGHTLCNAWGHHARMGKMCNAMLLADRCAPIFISVSSIPPFTCHLTIKWHALTRWGHSLPIIPMLTFAYWESHQATGWMSHFRASDKWLLNTVIIGTSIQPLLSKSPFSRFRGSFPDRFRFDRRKNPAFSLATIAKTR